MRKSGDFELERFVAGEQRKQKRMTIRRSSTPRKMQQIYQLNNRCAHGGEPRWRNYISDTAQ